MPAGGSEQDYAVDGLNEFYLYFASGIGLDGGAIDFTLDIYTNSDGPFSYTTAPAGTFTLANLDTVVLTFTTTAEGDLITTQLTSTTIDASNSFSDGKLKIGHLDYTGKVQCRTPRKNGPVDVHDLLLVVKAGDTEVAHAYTNMQIITSTIAEPTISTAYTLLAGTSENVGGIW